MSVVVMACGSHESLLHAALQDRSEEGSQFLYCVVHHRPHTLRASAGPQHVLLLYLLWPAGSPPPSTAPPPPPPPPRGRTIFTRSMRTSTSRRRTCRIGRRSTCARATRNTHSRTLRASESCSVLSRACQASPCTPIPAPPCPRAKGTRCWWPASARMLLLRSRSWSAGRQWAKASPAKRLAEGAAPPVATRSRGTPALRRRLWAHCAVACTARVRLRRI
jgi:hypothetical protein